MTSQQIVVALKNIKEDKDDIIDPACLRRLAKRTEDFGRDGLIAMQLLDIVKALLHL